ncbi:hypothetical protein VSDG_05935 [Cytospora chrysosperma]|uniref:Uncharacterized protein n=1 Tax=Cytospora chrysosperma TaxID=252740 RepID=A0A423VTW8_CYTCH|nr:hypothetical protein VSDG_05935 [Valsa sordida]
MGDRDGLVERCDIDEAEREFGGRDDRDVFRVCAIEEKLLSPEAAGLWVFGGGRGARATEVARTRIRVGTSEGVSVRGRKLAGIGTVMSPGAPAALGLERWCIASCHSGAGHTDEAVESRGFVERFRAGGTIDLRWEYLAIVALQVVLHDNANGTRTERE